MRRASAALAAVALLGGCAGDSAKIDESQLPELVLQPRDLPQGWVQFDSRRATREPVEGETPQEARASAATGWVARYRRHGTATTRGPLVVESRADVFDSVEAASRAIDATARGAGTAVDAPEIGDETVARTLLQPGVTPVRFYTIAWRRGNVVAAVTVNGFARQTTLADAFALARKQQVRIDRAATT